MTEKLKDYQVLDVLCGGTFYKVRHKVTNNIFAWKAYNCSTYSDKQIQNIVCEVRTISKLVCGNLLRYYDTILHGPSKTLYFVLEYNSWMSVSELIETCVATNKYITESFIWHLLFELARVCYQVADVRITVLQKCITTSSIFVNENGEIRINCFDLAKVAKDLMRQVGDVIHAICYQSRSNSEHQQPSAVFQYSDDLKDVISFLTDDRNSNLRPDVILYHPTMLANIETLTGPKQLKDIIVSSESTNIASNINKCDSEKEVELCGNVKPLPRRHLNVPDSPIYSNISPKSKINKEIDVAETKSDSLSPTLAALALELPGFVPRSRRPYSNALEKYACPQRVSEETLSQQWMSRLVALRQREESLNKRERDLIAKEIVNSPATKIVPLNESFAECDSNGITLPPVVARVGEASGARVARRPQRRAGSLRSRPRRKSYAYEDLDSSLSADAGDGSIIVTATKFTKENMPRRNIFPDISSKKVHFTSSNPFTESDESVTLTFYELENIDSDGYQMPRQKQEGGDIMKFKYLDLEKLTSEKRSAMNNWNHSSPSKQAKPNKAIFSDITNMDQGSMRKTPSKSSLISKDSNSSRGSVFSTKSQWSMDSACTKVSENMERGYARRSARLAIVQTPTAPPDVKKPKSRKSLLPFKTPFKFKTSTKV